MRAFLYVFLTVILFGCQQDKQKTNDKATSEASGQASGTQGMESTGNATNVYWGDTHLHTNLSLDAALGGNTLGLDEAYMFAKGEQVTSSTGLSAKLSRPLDFLVAADHSDGMGLFQSIEAGEEWIMNTAQGKRWNSMIKSGEGAEASVELIKAFSQKTMDMEPNDPELQKSVWSMTVEAAERHNNPGTFTAFIGYEWTSLIDGNNMHRVVIYRDNKDKTINYLPAVTYDVQDPESLWKHLSAYQEQTGGKVLAIPHNGNLSNGLMFAETRINGEPLDESYAKERSKWEPLLEVSQTKGDGESHPFLSPNDEFADFETWDFGNLDFSAVKTKDMLEHEYARSALKLGLKFKNELGTNPFKFGLVGSTDSHTSLSTADDNNFYGKTPHAEGGADRWKKPFMASDKGTIYDWQSVASGYAAVWARENTREALWDAMKRKETYATTGTRMTVRFFGSFDYNQDDLDNLVDKGYEKGVPMGGDISNADGKSPSFMIHAVMDPEGGSLDRVQVVKGWANADGTLGEQVYDVDWSGDRKIGSNGKLPAVPNTVDLEDGSWDNATGATELKTFWTDPDFDPAMEAFYYVRVLEIPTPRWTLYDQLKYNIKMDDEVPLTTQERAYTSPIWYSPN
ncbi:DUF3604 domain-containing protein [Algoriphagus sediminis]|uniref:DUF3604 domain-containing protein n=1 Tax=Algoriphagus sediminis TaxID=3057113 RepID=A0ABT7YDE1_9BACT|nr:DUF3604 domain-containing protein [Algoriphagus sediminis]MDN3204526.1 DUF3604 domain-containing protein [Algoriphagus sediminis]